MITAILVFYFCGDMACMFVCFSGILDRMQDPAKVITADSDVLKITTETDQVT